MRTVTCSVCGIVFAMPPEYTEARINDHATFFCSNGHGQHFPAASKHEEAMKCLAAKTKECDEWKAKWAAERKRAEKNWELYVESQSKLTERK